MPRRPYTMSEAALAARRRNAPLSNAPGRLIAKLEEEPEKLTLEERDRLAGVVVRNTPNREAPLPPETAAEIRRLLGGGSA
ncbi:hypothetical protein [Streptomyces sp. NBC_00588]|uniref:hypothetical protein n=1 Tax=Streptomyces sp. NBC_00588 TaxID=2975784 RepID=UPI002E81CFEE|nr:hypothetical protein [Streptomyces sp. NBC_00588]WUB35519.1 hypothetical protein OHN38_11560 [Streptomyces sp. NBC_00588]